MIESEPSGENSYTTSHVAPSSVTVDYVADDQLDVSWDGSANYGEYQIEIFRDEITWSNPAGGPSFVNIDTTSATYGPKSDNAYETQVGIDSKFRFRVRQSTEHGTSSWTYSNRVHTTPVPPRNVSVSRPDANTVTVNYETGSDVATTATIFYRKDSGGGYGSWNYVGDTDENVGSKGTSRSQTFSVSFNSWMDEDARYQFKIRHEAKGESNARLDSPFVYTDYGNNGNVYFEDNFESGDLSSWDNNNLAGDTGVKSSSGPADLQIDGAFNGTHYFYGEGVESDQATYLEKDLGDLSSATDVLVECTFATASLDADREDFGVSWYDGSAWQSLKHYSWEYNKQGWYNVSVVVPSSYLSSNNRIRVGTTTSAGMYGGDHFAVDSVVVSDVLHEYTSPTAPSNLVADTSSAREIILSWVANDTFAEYDQRIKKASESSYPNQPNTSFTSFTFSGLLDGEKYTPSVRAVIIQHRRGEFGTVVTSDRISITATTKVPSPVDVTGSVSTTPEIQSAINWSLDATANVSVAVERRSDSASQWSAVATGLPNTAKSYVDESVKEAESYDYRVVCSTDHLSAVSSILHVQLPEILAAKLGSSSSGSIEGAGEARKHLSADAGSVASVGLGAPVAKTRTLGGTIQEVQAADIPVPLFRRELPRSVFDGNSAEVQKEANSAKLAEQSNQATLNDKKSNADLSQDAKKAELRLSD